MPSFTSIIFVSFEYSGTSSGYIKKIFNLFIQSMNICIMILMNETYSNTKSIKVFSKRLHPMPTIANRKSYLGLISRVVCIM